MCGTKPLYAALLLLLPLLGTSQELITDLESILIRNVTVIDQAGKAKDLTVNILIKHKVLDLVTPDRVDLSAADIAFDANGGFVLGKLEVGNPAGFIILEEDPRTNDNVLLDTKSFALFAITKGEVALNRLIRIDADAEEQIRGWRSYAPPAVALPLSYQNSRKWNVFRTKPLTMVLGGAILMENTRWLAQDDINEQQVGELGPFKGGAMRGFRAGVGGTFNFKKPWTYLFTMGTRAFERGFEQGDLDEFVLYDYRVGIPVGPVTLTIGKTKETISISRLSAMIYEPAQQERASVADGLLPARNIGIVVSDVFMKDRMTWAAGVFNNWYEVDRSFSDNPTVVTGRVSALPYLSEDESNLLHIGIAGRYSNAAGGIQYKAKTEIFSGPVMVDTDLIDDASSTFHYGLEMAWRKGPLIVISEYLQSNVRSVAFDDPGFSGLYVVASYVLSGEMREYNKRSGTFNRIKVANGLNSGGWGELEVFSRWSSFHLNDQNINGGAMNTWSLGLNWTPVMSVQTNINYRYSTLDRMGERGANHGMVVRLSFILE